MVEKENLVFSYTFVKEDGSIKIFEIQLDPQTLDLIHEPFLDLPFWTELEFSKCPNCPLNKEQVPNCPIAANIVGMAEVFKDSKSFENANVQITTSQREYNKEASLQQGVSSMLGMIMVTAGCPILSKLRPMVRFHLPFASIEETIYRAVSMYLVKQYFKSQDCKDPDWELNGLMDIYKEIHDVNKAFFNRLSSLKGKDANVNALIILDNFANYINFSIDRNKLSKIKWMFDDTGEQE
ncbi:MAG: hypothetical protein KAS53_02990 [Candidatus Cloacimonetes bacterium]|nr:hypothetical protein [Candidatus Cloacimonadota bacterium]